MASHPDPFVVRATIHFAAHDGQPIHAPTVLATVGAIHTRLNLDTGSDVHLLAGEVARAAGLRLDAVDAGTDPAGATLDSRIAREVEVARSEGAGAGLTLGAV